MRKRSRDVFIERVLVGMVFKISLSVKVITVIYYAVFFFFWFNNI